MKNEPASLRRRYAASLSTLFALLFGSTGYCAQPVERDICENRTGQDLIRCIESSARGQLPPRATPAVPPVRPAPATAPAVAEKAVPPLPQVTASPEPPPFPPQDCTGRVDQELRRCLAGGGRLQSSAAVVPPTSAIPTPTQNKVTAPEGCDGKTGDELRQCIERTAKAPLRLAADRTVDCTGYHPADQPLCVHRNTAIAECRNRKKYPDLDVCLRSQMTRAPEPKDADCQRAAPHARGHCESRNRVYRSCTGDKIGYFACLERHLGSDAVLRRR